MVKLGGRRASLAGLSRILTGIEGVQDGVFLAPDDLDRARTRGCSPSPSRPSLSVASLTEALRARVDPVFLPRPLVLWTRCRATPLGKLPRAALLAALAGRGEGGSSDA